MSDGKRNLAATLQQSAARKSQEMEDLSLPVPAIQMIQASNTQQPPDSQVATSSVAQKLSLTKL